MKTFEEIKKLICESAKSKGACSDQYKRALKSENEKELLQVISDNLSWCISNEVITHSIMAEFNETEYLKSGIANTGKENTGFRNSGSWNSGDRNSGDSNSGYRNSGYRNSGDRNSGSWNSGDRNSGDSNSGYRNSGSWNSGDRNSGDSNSGYRNSGAFCSDPNPKVWLFDQPTDIPVREWENSRACRIMSYLLSPNIWIWESEMTDEEKAKYPTHTTTGGYLKSLSMHEAWANMWGNLDDDSKNVFLTLPNFNAEKFTQITGVKL